MSDAAARLADEIVAALDHERRLALGGAFGALADAAAARDRQIERLLALGAGAAKTIAPQLEVIRAAATRNMGLMQAALDGAEAGRRYLRDIREARERLSGYDASGAPRVHSAPPSGRKA